VPPEGNFECMYGDPCKQLPEYTFHPDIGTVVHQNRILISERSKYTFEMYDAAYDKYREWRAERARIEQARWEVEQAQREEQRQAAIRRNRSEAQKLRWERYRQEVAALQSQSSRSPERRAGR